MDGDWICRGCAGDYKGKPSRIVVTNTSLLKFCDECGPRVMIAPGVGAVSWKHEVPLREVAGPRPESVT